MTPADFSLHPDLDAAALAAFTAALESGDTDGLPPARAAQVADCRAAASFGRVKVAGAEGTLLDGALWRHPGSDARPVVVMPSPWSDLGWLAYAVQASVFAARGYNVLAYSVRGFGASEGEADVAGPLDTADGSRALDHLVERTAGPVSRIGFLGEGYGAAIALLTAAHDSRIDAVAALSGWGDLGEVLVENRTRHTAAVEALLRSAGRARLSPRAQSVFEDVAAGRDIAAVLRWAAQRSPSVHAKELVRRRVPVYFSHAWHETLFPANQTLRLFEELAGPKRIDLSVGDHAGPEAAGLAGLPNRIWTTAHRWFDHHLRGAANGIDEEGEVLGEVMWSRTLEPRPTWPSVTDHVRRLYLADGGELADTPEAGWSAGVVCGVDTPAVVADAVAGSGHAELAGLPRPYPTGEIDRAVTAVWVADPEPETARLRGTPRLRVTYRTGNARSGFVAYLLDVAPDGTGRLVTHAPYADLDSAPDSLVAADIDLQATAYDVPRGNRLMLVAAARDPFYGDVNPPRATLAFTSPEETPSYLELPLG